MEEENNKIKSDERQTLLQFRREEAERNRQYEIKIAELYMRMMMSPQQQYTMPSSKFRLLFLEIFCKNFPKIIPLITLILNYSFRRFNKHSVELNLKLRGQWYQFTHLTGPKFN